MSTPSGLCLTHFPSNHQPPNISFKLTFLQTYEDCSDEDSVPPHKTITAQHFHHSTVAHTSEKMEPRDSKDDAKVAGIDEQATGEIEGVTEGEGVTTALVATTIYD